MPKAKALPAPVAAIAETVAPVAPVADAETVATETVAPVADAIAAPVAETVAETVAPVAPDAAQLRQAARAIFAQFDGAASLPIKPLATFKAYRPALGVLKSVKPSPRQAATLCVAALASGQQLHGADAIAYAAQLLSAYASAKPETADAETAKQALRAFLAETAVSMPRRFNLGADAFATENGATADCVASGLAAYNADAETFTIHALQSRAIRGLLGARAKAAFAD